MAFGWGFVWLPMKGRLAARSSGLKRGNFSSPFPQPKTIRGLFFHWFLLLSGYIIVYVKFQVSNPSTRAHPKDFSLHPCFIDSPGGSFVRKGISPASHSFLRKYVESQTNFLSKSPLCVKNKQTPYKYQGCFQNFTQTWEHVKKSRSFWYQTFGVASTSSGSHKSNYRYRKNNKGKPFAVLDVSWAGKLRLAMENGLFEDVFDVNSPLKMRMFHCQCELTGG